MIHGEDHTDLLEDVSPEEDQTDIQTDSPPPSTHGKNHPKEKENNNEEKLVAETLLAQKEITAPEDPEGELDDDSTPPPSRHKEPSNPAKHFKIPPQTQGLLKSQMNLEMAITWKGQLYQSHLYKPGQQVMVGVSSQSTYLPVVSGEYHLADYDSHYVHCYLPKNCDGKYISADSVPLSLKEMKPSLPKKDGRHYLKINSSDVCVISLTENIDITLRYIPAPRQLTKSHTILPEQLLKKTIAGSGLSHLMAVIFMFLLSPRQPDVNIRNLPPRVAKLLIEKPKKKPEPPEIKKKEVVKKKKLSKKKKKTKVAKKKRLRKPRKVFVKKNQRIKRMNNNITRTTSKKKRRVKNLGALAALGRVLPNNKPISKPVALNINPKAGGASSKVNTRGIIGTLKTRNGRLPTTGIEGVKTRGKGYGTGTGYGVQGLKGRAGHRGVAGLVARNPKLLKVKRSEGLTKKQVMSVVQRHVGKIQSCYERALLSSPGIAGRVEYEWYITPKGRVKWSKVKRSEISNGDILNNCITKVFKKMKFPIAKNGESTVPRIGFPFGRL